MPLESNTYGPDPHPGPNTDPNRPTRPLEPGEAELGAKDLEAWNFAKAYAPGSPSDQQIIAAQYLYKKYGILPNNGQGDWQHGNGGGAKGWELINGDLVPKDRSWWDKYGMLMVAAGVVTAGVASAFIGPAAAGAGGLGGVEGGAAAGLGSAALPGAGTALGGAGAAIGGGAAAAGGAGAATGAGATAAGGSVIPAATYGPGGAVSSFSTVAPQGATYGAAGGGAASTALRYGIPAATDLISGFIQANATEKASDKQAALLQQALDYEKEQDALNRTIAADKVKLEAGRYATYTGNISPYLQSGNAANNKMTSLLGLPQNAPMTAPPQTTITPTSAPANVTTQPLPRSADQTVTMQGPDGSQKQVPANQVDHYKQLGATVIGAVA